MALPPVCVPLKTVLNELYQNLPYHFFGTQEIYHECEKPIGGSDRHGDDARLYAFIKPDSDHSFACYATEHRRDCQYDIGQPRQ
ncbi:hypothetical protein D3C81_2139580 [compost metagenome]